MTDSSTLLRFTLTGAAFAIAVERVDAVVPFEQIVALPGTDGAVLGLASVRGTVVAVVDPRPALGAPPRPTTAHATGSLLIVSTASGRFGLLVDGVEILPSDGPPAIDPPGTDDPHPVLGMAAGGLPLVDPERLVAPFVVTE